MMIGIDDGRKQRTQRRVCCVLRSKMSLSDAGQAEADPRPVPALRAPSDFDALFGTGFAGAGQPAVQRSAAGAFF
jgi:hypothetical protein